MGESRRVARAERKIQQDVLPFQSTASSGGRNHIARNAKARNRGFRLITWCGRRLELSHLAAPEPKSGVSTNFTTSAKRAKRKRQAAPGVLWNMGWTKGIEPSTPEPQSCALPTELRPPYYALLVPEPEMAHPAGLEPATIRLEGGCSIQLSYEALLSAFCSGADLKLRPLKKLFF